MATQQQKNKDLVLKAMQDVYGDKRVEEVDNYFHQDLIAHDPNMADGIDAVRDFIKNDKEPPHKLDIKRVAADGDLVWVHLKYPSLGTQMAVMEIWRVENDKIKEHWILYQDTKLTEPAKNPHPFF